MKLNIYKLILFFVFLGVGCLFFKGYLYKKEIEDNREQTVCKFVYCKKFPKTTESFFEYQINNKFYRNSYGKCPNNYDQIIKKFFVLYYSAKDPNKIEVDFSKQVTNTDKILESGFTEEDIER